ncbi:hypothetical protein N8T08_000494 [Aspergillus melleus]|uniref:Uncharacterized protein n=1 Tax=Aspergillus melleus TaxID=138277 RepID=A0ACC3BC08_9EURO|nr:hypothetical protein N8T08_000494 [Aspergillus melleus]
MTTNQPVPDDRYKLHLGATRAHLPLQSKEGLFSADPVVQSIVDAGSTGDGTQKYHERIQGITSLYTDLSQETDNLPPNGHDEHGNDVYYKKKVDGSGTPYWLAVKFEGLVKDKNGDIMPDGRTVTINNKQYQTVGMITHTVGYGNIEYAKYSRWAGTTALGYIPFQMLMPYIKAALGCIWGGVKLLCKGLFTGIQKLASEGLALTGASVRYTALEAAQGVEADLAGSGAVEILSTGTEAVALEGGAAAAAAEGGVAAVEVGEGMLVGGLSLTCLGVCVGLAVICYAISEGLHNTFHQVRVFNLTGHTMIWRYHFNTVRFINYDVSSVGKIVEGPGIIENDTIIPQPIPAAQGDPGIPGVQGSPEVHHGDISIVSSNEATGIGYVLQLDLRNRSTNETVQTVTVYYDIPLGSPIGHFGDNSTNLTFERVDDMAEWYNNNAGNNQKHVAMATSTDGRYEARSTYDYLNGEHGIPARLGQSTNKAYFYRSVLYVLDKFLKIEDL